MARPDATLPRLHVDLALTEGGRVALERAQANYLVNVLRLGDGDEVLLFNGRDGEWRARLRRDGRRDAALEVDALSRAQTALPDLHLLFAPLKHARLDYMVQKAVEMGASRLRPVRTRRTQASRVNLDRMRANVVEAAEQCDLLALAEVAPEEALEQAVGGLDPDRLLVFCDEEAPSGDPLVALAAQADAQPRNSTVKLAVVVGPEGGFTDEERALVGAHPRTLRLSLGPRILRADTAAVAVLALVQAALGDWR